MKEQIFLIMLILGVCVGFIIYVPIHIFITIPLIILNTIINFFIRIYYKECFVKNMSLINNDERIVVGFKLFPFENYKINFKNWLRIVKRHQINELDEFYYHWITVKTEKL